MNMKSKANNEDDAIQKAYDDSLEKLMTLNLIVEECYRSDCMDWDEITDEEAA